MNKIYSHNSAVLVIDMQDRWVVPGSDATHTSSLFYASETTLSLRDRLNDALDEFRKVSLPVIWVQYNSDVPTPLSMAPKDGEPIFDKVDDNAFSDKNPDLERYLRKNGIKNIFLTGVNYSACVKSSAKGALKKDFHAITITDLCANGSIVNVMFEGAVKPWPRDCPQATHDWVRETLSL